MSSGIVIPRLLSSLRGVRAPRARASTRAGALRSAAQLGTGLCALSMAWPSRARAEHAVSAPYDVTGEECEEKTGAKFPRRTAGHDGRDLKLMGTCARLMRGLVHVYAVGIYLRDDMDLSAWRGMRADEIARNGSFWRAVCGEDGRECVATVRLVVARQVEGRHMANGFVRALKSRVEKGGMKRVRDLCLGFERVGVMKVGCEARFVVGGGCVRVVVEGRETACVRDEELCRAVLDVFLGERGVVLGLREQVAQGICEAL